MMDGDGKSDTSIVPEKPPNNAGGPAAEAVEGRGVAKGNSLERNACRTQSREGAPSALERVRDAARRDRKLRFTALLHHVYAVERLRQAYYALKREAAAGHRRRDVEALRRAAGSQPRRPVPAAQTGSVPSEACTAGVHREGGRAAAAARCPRAGRQDRPARRRRGAQRHLRTGLPRLLVWIPPAAQPASCPECADGGDPDRRRVNWVLDADIRSFFDTLDHELAGEVRRAPRGRPARRAPHPEVAEGRRAGGRSADTERGRHGPGRRVSVRCWPTSTCTTCSICGSSDGGRSRRTGEVIVVRYADDFVVGFEHRNEAEQFLADLRERFAQFGLELHPDKTRLIEFGRWAAREPAAARRREA